ncbi:MAG TPA: hypothetical protein VLE99_03295 [Candidatus Saccharimonadales bacterium]|nr:hypothetical protein [Candidatus Saccharimonadales bacterium]
MPNKNLVVKRTALPKRDRQFSVRSQRWLLLLGFAVLTGIVGPILASMSFASGTLHYTANSDSSLSQIVADGFNLVDISGSTSNPSSTASTVNALPSGVQALVWVGNLDNSSGPPCPAPGFTLAQYEALVDGLAHNSKVYGYFLSDEPHPSICPNAASDIQARADYLHQKAPAQKAFIVVLDGSNQCGSQLGCEYAALSPTHTHVDLIGLDPYPCHYSGSTAVPCNNSQITDRYNSAIASGIPASAIVPVFQTFGQEGRSDGGSVYYRTPSATELQSMLDTWKTLVPNPAFDYAYSWGVQCGSSCPSPQALSNHAELQAVMSGHNGASAPSQSSQPQPPSSPTTPSPTGSGSSGTTAPAKGGSTTTPSSPAQSTSPTTSPSSTESLQPKAAASLAAQPEHGGLLPVLKDSAIGLVIFAALGVVVTVVMYRVKR